MGEEAEAIATMLVVRGELFNNTEREPDWLVAAKASHNGGDWHKHLDRVLGDRQELGEDEAHYGRALIWRTPGGGRYVVVHDGGLGGHDAVWVPEATDWPRYRDRHLMPGLHLEAMLQLGHHVARLADAVIAFARHGHGEHISRDTGQSEIDRRREREEWARERRLFGAKPDAA